jgi:hypothetical protein
MGYTVREVVSVLRFRATSELAKTAGEPVEGE